MRVWDYIPNIVVCQVCFVPKHYDKFPQKTTNFVIKV